MHLKLLLLGSIFIFGNAVGLLKPRNTREVDDWTVVDKTDLECLKEVFRWLGAPPFCVEYHTLLNDVAAGKPLLEALEEYKDLFVLEESGSITEHGMRPFLQWFFNILNESQGVAGFDVIKDSVPACIAYLFELNNDGQKAEINSLTAQVYCGARNRDGMHYYTNTCTQFLIISPIDIRDFSSECARRLVGKKTELDAPSPRVMGFFKIDELKEYKGPVAHVLAELINQAQETGKTARLYGYAGENSFVYVTVNRLEIVSPQITASQERCNFCL